MRVVLCSLIAFACLSGSAAAQNPSIDFSELRPLLGQGEKELQKQHEQAYRELDRILNGRQMTEMRQMSQWGRYGPPMDATVEGKSLLDALSQPNPVQKLMPTPGQEADFSKALQGSSAGMEARLRAVLTPEQYEFLRQLERVEQSEDW